MTDPTDRSVVATSRGSVVKPDTELESEAEAEAVMSEAWAETVSLALTLAVAVALAGDDASSVTEALADWLEG